MLNLLSLITSLSLIIIGVCSYGGSIGYTYTPSKWHGEKTIGPRIQTFDPLDKDQVTVHRATERLPIEISKVWSIFDDFFEFERSMPSHFNTRRVPNTPENGVGAEIAFDYNEITMIERLVLKDDKHYIWRIEIISDTSLVKQYRATVSLFEDTKNHGTIMMIDMEYSLYNDELPVREEINKYSINNLFWYPKILYDLSLQKHGIVSHYQFDVVTPIDFIWNMMSDWNNVAWVPAVVGEPEMLARDIRKIHTNNNGYIMERLSFLDAETHTLEYQILAQEPNKYKIFQDVIQLTKIDEHNTHVTIKGMFIPLDVSESHQLVEGFQQLMDWSAKFMQQKLPELMKQQKQDL